MADEDDLQPLRRAGSGRGRAMDRERWLQVDRLFAEALERPPAEWPAFLDAACAGDSALRQDVERLLAADQAAAGFLTAPASAELLARALNEPEKGPASLAGRTLSHFRLGAPLGSGGMGVVYEAEDTRLGRPVALKFLAPELGRDPAAKEMFLFEARAASALDHPNLCTILEAGESDDGLLFLAMPHYDGESLDRRIARDPLPLDEALEIALQTARGLAKAHRHGIVHRDIKPANLFVTRDGVVKILDFGIAKLAGEVEPARQGAILGTPSYMAPEQTRGEPVDARADVWALGVVLYEMLAGRRPFAGATGAAVLPAALRAAPQALTRLRPEVPPEVERILSRLLAEDPGERYADAAAALADLQSVAPGLPATGSRSGARGRPRRRPAWAALAAAALAAVAGGLLVWQRGGAPPDPLSGQIVRLTDLQGLETFPSLSPDGTHIVYTKFDDSDADLFLQRVAGGLPTNLTAGSPALDSQPAFSPDGRRIAFRSEREGGGIFLMETAGRAVRRLTDFGFNPAWSPDGREIAIATDGVFDPRMRSSAKSRIVRVDVATGAKRELAVDDGVQPAWSPRGLRIAFWGLAHPGNRRAIWTVPADGGPAVTVVDDAFYNWSPVWSPDGRYLYFASNRSGTMNLWRLAVDERSGRVSGAPQPVTASSEWSALPSFSRDGRRLIYATDSSRSYVELVPFDPRTAEVAGPPAVAYEGARAILSCDVSPDGAWLVLWASFPSEDLLLVRPDGSGLRPLTDDIARDRSPRWAPDGSRILFASNRGGKYEAWTIRPDGSGLTQVTRFPDQPVLFPFWSPDGARIGFFHATHGTALLDLRRPGARPRLLPAAGEGEIFAGSAWGRDGTLAGLMSTRQGRTAPGVILWSPRDITYRRLSRTGIDPVFLRSGSRLLFREAGTIRLADLAGGEVRTVLSPPPHSFFQWVGTGPGDRQLCTVRATNEGDIWSLSLAGPPA